MSLEGFYNLSFQNLCLSFSSMFYFFSNILIFRDTALHPIDRDVLRPCITRQLKLGFQKIRQLKKKRKRLIYLSYIYNLRARRTVPSGTRVTWRTFSEEKTRNREKSLHFDAFIAVFSHRRRGRENHCFFSTANQIEERLQKLVDEVKRITGSCPRRSEETKPVALLKGTGCSPRSNRRKFPGSVESKVKVC